MSRLALLVCLIAPALLLTGAAQDRQPDRPAAERISPVPSIIVTGFGSSSAQPDQATVMLGASAEEKEAAAAQAAVNTIMNAAIEAIVADVGIAEDMIDTTGLELYPVYSQPQPRSDGTYPEPRITGYRAANSIRIRINDLDKVGDAIDAAIAKGVNQLHGITFGMEDDTRLQLDALRKAVRQGSVKAQAMAEGLGVQLGDIIEVQEGSVQPIVPMMEMAAMGRAMADASTPIQPGQVRVEATVTIRFRIGNRETQ